MMRTGAIGMILLALLTAGCMKDDALWDFHRTSYAYPSAGVFVTNQGNFMYGNASLTYYDPESRAAIHDVFYHSNALPLGDVAQSMVIQDTLGFVVMNNSGRIYALNTSTFQLAGKITGLTSPRYMHFLGPEKAYVSDLYARSIAIVNPRTFEVTGAIDVSNQNSDYYQHATEQMIQVDRYVYTNCWSFDRQILVIDSWSDRVIDSIEVIKQPNSMVLDRYQTLWVLCDGGFPESPYGYEQAGLMKISPGAREAEIVFRFEEGSQPRELNISGSGDTLYFLNGGVYRHGVLSETAPELLIESPYPEGYQGGFYALGVDPVSTEIYVADAIDFVQPGQVYRYSSVGALMDEFRAGIGPGGFCFKP